MEIIVSDKAGFCFGVQRAVDIVMKETEVTDEPVYTFGPIAHNEHVVNALREKGVRILTPENMKEMPKGRVVIRAHGIPEETEKELRAAGFTVLDATCPFVKKIHRIAEEQSLLGRHILIIGDPGHPEVQGIVGRVKGPCTVIRDEQDLQYIAHLRDTPCAVVAQTTYNLRKFKIIVEKLHKIVYNAIVANTVCSATKERQDEAEAISSRADVMLVIGSPSSSNSQKLYEICSKKCSHTYFIQSMTDLKDEWFQDIKCVGITAGASTPKNIIREVQTHVREF